MFNRVENLLNRISSQRARCFKSNLQSSKKIVLCDFDSNAI